MIYASLFILSQSKRSRGSVPWKCSGSNFPLKQRNRTKYQYQSAQQSECQRELLKIQDLSNKNRLHTGEHDQH
ncbi:uncharacterized protein METZ01_LOCUS296362 [marine metagenome]|uniref:Uncharacterized protein n=1 Tax=marine metagenome TaxID=408172 RepID=A0A382M4G2_9ZZZZ